MNAAIEDFSRLNVQIGENRTDWYFDLPVEAEKARGYAYQLGARIHADDRVSVIPEGDFITDAHEFRNGVLAQIMENRDLRLEHKDSLDALFNTRVIEVRNALRSQGWEGDAYDTLTKDGASAVFRFDHSPIGRNVIGMWVNDIEDTLELPAEHLAEEVTGGAQEHLKRSRRVDVQIVSKDGANGNYSVAFGTAGQLEETAISWKPEQPDSATEQVQLRMRRYGRLDGSPYVLSGDTWRDIEGNGGTATLWKNLLSGVPAEQAVQNAQDVLDKGKGATNEEIEYAQSVAAKYGMAVARLANNADKTPTVGPVVAITPAYVIQNVGMNNAVMHAIGNFQQLPAMGARSHISYEAGKAIVRDGRGDRDSGQSR